MNDERMAISEIGAAYADYTFGKESRKGIPFTYLLRDVLQYDKDSFQNLIWGHSRSNQDQFPSW